MGSTDTEASVTTAALYYEQYERTTLAYGDVQLSMRFVSKLAPTDALALLDGTDITGQKLWRGALVLCWCAKLPTLTCRRARRAPGPSLSEWHCSYRKPIAWHCSTFRDSRVFSFLASQKATVPSGVRIIELGCGTSALPTAGGKRNM
jgi:hypothetical protein